MRINQPVSQRETTLPPDETLLSTTDTQGCITYANAAFSRACGFSNEELVGQPHNLVRHPDMPVEAFADMWKSLKVGQSWTALVKNRSKAGDHYWVRANATPMRRNGQLTGYLSVRTVPSREEVDAAEGLYRRVREGRAAGLAFHRGLVVRTGLMRWASALQLLPTVWRSRLPLLCAAVVLVGALPLAGVSGIALGVMTGLVVGSLLLAACFIETQITRPLRKMAVLAQQVASGEAPKALSFNRCDDIGLIARSINQAGLNLQSLVEDVHEQASGVRGASLEISATTNDLSSHTELAAASLERTSAAMEQQTASVHQNSDTAQQASQLAHAATEIAVKGGHAMANMASMMTRITASSSKIVDIIGVIDSIAFQTNILALNAAVEAARAGEQGRGFAVVASEVRSLAGRSAAAAKEIKGLIDASVANVENGSKLVQDAEKTMIEVVQQVKSVNALMAEITVASKEQSIGISQVGQAVAQLDEMTQQNVTIVGKNRMATTHMGEQALRLMGAVQVFSDQARSLVLERAPLRLPLETTRASA